MSTLNERLIRDRAHRKPAGTERLKSLDRALGSLETEHSLRRDSYRYESSPSFQNALQRTARDSFDRDRLIVNGSWYRPSSSDYLSASSAAATSRYFPSSTSGYRSSDIVGTSSGTQDYLGGQSYGYDDLGSTYEPSSSRGYYGSQRRY
jgi:hypothetical protein